MLLDSLLVWLVYLNGQILRILVYILQNYLGLLYIPPKPG